MKVTTFAPAYLALLGSGELERRVARPGGIWTTVTCAPCVGTGR